MILLGLTGSIGMGKSATAQMFAEMGLPVFDSDQAVYQLYDKGGAAVPLIEAAFPGSIQDGVVNREILSTKIKGSKRAWRELEAIVHPLVAQCRDTALQKAAGEGVDIFVLDIPLLYENKLEGTVDYVVVVSAPPDVQRQRVLERPGMTEEKFNEILSHQISNQRKCEMADFVIDTSQGFDVAKEQVKKIVDSLREGPIGG